MGQTLSNFLIGIGIQNDTTKGAREVTSALDSIKRTSLQASAAVMGMTGGLSLMAGKTASNIRTFDQFAERIGGSTDLIAAQSEAWQRAGGSASGYLALMERLAKMRSGILRGDVGWIEEAAKVGLNYGDMLNTAPDELLPKIIERMNRMNQQQRLNAVDMLGAEPVLTNIAADGRGAFDDQTQKQLERLTITKQMVDQSEQLVTNWSDFKSELSAAADVASLSLMPTMNELLETTLAWAAANREGLHGGVASTMEALSENIGAVAGGLVALNVAGLGATAEKFTKLGGTANGVGRLAKNLGLVGVAAAGASVGAGLIDEQLQKSSLYNRLDAKFTEDLFNFTGFDFSRGKVHTDNREEIDLDAMARDMMTRVPEFEPTIIEPAQVAQLETARESTRAQTYHEAMASYAPPAQQSYPARKTEEHIHVHLNEREVAHFIRQVNSQDAEQAVRDLRSPIDR